jgi:hypothetical protein
MLATTWPPLETVSVPLSAAGAQLKLNVWRRR